MDAWRRFLARHPLETLYREIAAREGMLLKYLARDEETMRLVESNAGQVRAIYERIDRERLSQASA